MTYDTMTPAADYNDKNLTCRGSVDGYPSMEATVKLDVECELLDVLLLMLSVDIL